MSKSNLNVLPRKNILRKLMWAALFVLAVVWVVKHPYQARDAWDNVAHAVNVLFAGSGR